MITYWVTRAASGGLQRYLEGRGRPVADRFQTALYDSVDGVVRMLAGPQIFSDLDRLTATQLELAARLWEGHARGLPDATRLNDPRRVKRRFELLTRLHECGINEFRVYAADAFEDVRSFPVFVRERYRHNGPRTPLLDSANAVERALTGLKLRGHRISDLMIVEFCNTVSADGLFRKYAAYKVGNTILACHVLRSTRWFTKSSGNLPDEAGLREEAEYVQANPHDEWLRRVFDIAGVDYGRVDYGVLNGVPQVWEINLNPTLGSGTYLGRRAALSPALRGLREQSRVAYHQRLQAAFAALDRDTDAQGVDIAIEVSLLDRLRGEVARRQRRERTWQWLRSLPDSLRVGTPVRAAYYRLFPRR
jgi:hypothetical protein